MDWPGFSQTVTCCSLPTSERQSQSQSVRINPPWIQCFGIITGFSIRAISTAISSCTFSITVPILSFASLLISPLSMSYICLAYSIFVFTQFSGVLPSWSRPRISVDKGACARTCLCPRTRILVTFCHGA